MIELDELKIGDKVVVKDHYRLAECKVVEVVKITKTQLTLSNGKRYLRTTGDEWGVGPYGYGSRIMRNFSTLQLMTPEEAEHRNWEVRNEANRNENLRTIRNFSSWRSVSDKDIKAILNILKKYIKEK